MGRLRFVAHCFVRLCQRGRSHDSLGDVHVDRPRRPNLVRLRLGNPAAGNRVLVDLSLPVARWPPVSEMPAAVARHLAFSLARFSHHDRRRLDQTARRPMLGGSHLPLLSLRNPANSESDQSLFAFRSALVSQIRTAWNHFIELVVPWFSFGPRAARHIAGVLLVSFQLVLIISGNLSFLNYVTIIPFLACFDDTFLRRFLPASLVRRAERAAQESEPSRINNTIAIALSILVIYLSIAPVLNLVSGRQLMNYSYDPFDLVNTYGAFGTVGRERPEIIFEGT